MTAITDALIAKAQTYFPDLKIVEKHNSTLMRVVATIMFFNPGFMTDFTTTVGSTVYVPNTNWLDSNLSILIHELVHMYDEKRIGVWYKLGYLFPQILAVLMLPLVFFLHWYVWLPLFILFALPLPALFRAHFERRAYLVQMSVYVKVYHFTEKQVNDSILPYFKNTAYYFMDPWQSDLTLADAQALLSSDAKLSAMVDDLVSTITPHK